MKTKTTKTSKRGQDKRKAKAVATTAKPNKKLSQIDAAVEVLGKAKESMNCKAMTEAMTAKGLWSSPNGKTPEATLYASILRELKTKGKDARFVKVAAGKFAVRE